MKREADVLMYNVKEKNTPGVFIFVFFLMSLLKSQREVAFDNNIESLAIIIYLLIRTIFAVFLCSSDREF